LHGGGLMNHVSGVDFSLVACGVANVTAAGEMVTHVVKSAGKRADSLVDRHQRLTHHAAQIVEAVGYADLAVIEGPSFGSVGGAQFDRYAGWWFVVSRLIEREVPVAVMPPASLKLAIADHGRADKAAMASAITRMYPDITVFSSDISDAMGLAHLGAVRLGWPVKTLERHRKAKCMWPLFGIDDVAVA
jgi:crossover junction endodeoxyribonuclease RuvC